MERRLAVHARAHRKALSGLLAAAVLLTGASLASAAPKTPEAKAAFDRGVAAYTANDYAAASEALGQSYALEPDVETLFAWAQTARKLERCDKASELYGKLLAYDLPDENKAAIRTKLEDCKAIMAAQKPVEQLHERTTVGATRDKQIGRLEIAVHDAPRMRLRERDACLHDEVDRGRDR